jgi:hypothetical protein
MEAILAAVEPFSVHGTPFVRLAYATRDEPDRIVQTRVGAEALYPGAKPGDRVEIRMLLGVIDEVKKVNSL